MKLLCQLYVFAIRLTLARLRGKLRCAVVIFLPRNGTKRGYVE